MQRRIVERPLAREKRRLGNRASDFFRDRQTLIQRRLRKDDDEFITAVSGNGRVFRLHDSFQKETDLAQNLTPRQMSMLVVDELELIEIEKHQHCWSLCIAR